MAQEAPKTQPPKQKPAVQNGAATAVPPRTPPLVKKEKKSGWILWLVGVLLLVLAGATGWYFYSHQGQPAATAGTGSGHGKHAGGDVIRVVTAKSTLGDIPVYLNGLGSVTPLTTVTIKARVDGQLMKVLFQEGQMVKAGDQLVQIDDRPYKAQVAQYTAQKEHDQALLDNAKIDLDRYQTLWKQDSIPQQQLATQEALVKQDQGTVDSDQALIDTAQLNVTYCDITAPVSGRVGLRLVDEGNQVHASDTNGLLVLTQVQPITVVFTIPEDNIQSVLDKLNAHQTLAVDAYDREMKEKLASGTLLTTDNQIDQTTGTLRLKAIFPNDKNELFPNQFVNVRLLVDTKKDVTLVPVAAIQHGTQGSFVYVVNTPEDGEGSPAADATPTPAPAPDASAPASSTPAAAGASAGGADKGAVRTVSLQNIEVGTIEGGQAEITSGLEPGQTVVTDGVDKLQSGSKVIVTTPGGGSGHHHQSGASTASVDNGS